MVQKDKFFLFELFAFDMQGMKGVVFFNDEFFEELDSCVFQLDVLSQAGKFFISPGQFFFHRTELILELTDHEFVDFSLLAFEEFGRVVHNATFLFEFNDILEELIVLFFEGFVLFLKLFQVGVNVNGFE